MDQVGVDKETHVDVGVKNGEFKDAKLKNETSSLVKKIKDITM